MNSSVPGRMHAGFALGGPLLVAAFLAFTAAVARGAGTSGMSPDAPGAVVVFPVEGEPPPGIERTVQLLAGVGLSAPGYRTQFVDGATLLEGLRGGVQVVGPVSPAECPAGAPALDAESFARSLERASHQVFLTEYEAAGQVLRTVREALACAGEPVPRDLLYRLHFLLGVVARFDGDEEAAARWFQFAAAIDPEQGFDSSFPPIIWQAYVKGRDALLASPVSNLRTNLEHDQTPVFLDGERIDPAARTPVAAGYHLLQVEMPTVEGGTPGYHTLAFEVKGSGPLWLVDDAAVARLSRLGRAEPNPGDRDLFVDLLVNWAASQDQAWALAVFPAAGARSLDHVLFCDVASRTTSAPPEWMTLSPGGTSLVTDEGLAGAHSGASGFKRVAAGWELDAGTIIYQPLPPSDTRYYGLEVGGVRTITGNVSAHVAFALGIKTVSQQGAEGLFASFVAGVRRSWEWTPFGFYLEGAVGGFDVTRSHATLAVHLRPGAYYRLVPGGPSILGFWFGNGFVVLAQSGSRWMGSFGVEFRYSW